MEEQSGISARPNNIVIASTTLTASQAVCIVTGEYPGIVVYYINGVTVIGGIMCNKKSGDIIPGVH